MSIKTKYILLIFFLLTISCKNGNHFYNVSKVEIYGDSLRIETEIYGDSIIKHYIDLKGTSDNGFDNSFNVTIIRKSKVTPKFECKDDFKFQYKEFEILFCKNDLKKELNRQKFTKEIADSIGINTKIDSMIGTKYNSYLVRFIEQINYQIIQRETKDTLKKILKGDYRTEFSMGIQYEVINSNQDTIYLFERNLIMF